MNSLKDERINFYLEHEDRIKEWAAVENDVYEFAHGFYLTLKDQVVEELARRELSADASSYGPIGAEWVKIGLRREGWPSTDEFRPGVTIEWHRTKTGFTAQHLILGVHNSSVIEEHYESIFGGIGWKHSPWWFAYRHLTRPQPLFWEEDGLAKYRKSLVNQLFDAWRDLRDAVDEAVKVWETKQQP